MTSESATGPNPRQEDALEQLSRVCAEYREAFFGRRLNLEEAREALDLILEGRALVLRVQADWQTVMRTPVQGGHEAERDFPIVLSVANDLHLIRLLESYADHLDGEIGTLDLTGTDVLDPSLARGARRGISMIAQSITSDLSAMQSYVSVRLISRLNELVAQQGQLTNSIDRSGRATTVLTWVIVALTLIGVAIALVTALRAS